MDLSKPKLSKKERRAARIQAQKQRRQRIWGLVGLAVLTFAALFVWQSTNRVPLEDLRAQAPPNIDGPADAAVKVVEYGDFGCPACRVWHQVGVKEQLQARFGEQVSFEFRHFPVITAQSPTAAVAAQCAAEQGAFWAFHDYIYDETTAVALSRGDLKRYAAAIGLEGDSFAGCLDSEKYMPLVRADWDRALQVGARGTPTFLIDGQRVNPDYQSMAAIIANMLTP